MPALIISKLQIGPNLKAVVVVLLSLGVVNLALAILTLVYNSIPLGTDSSYAAAKTSTIAAVQLFIVIIVCSIPFIRPLFTHSEYLKLSFFRSSRRKLTGSGQSPEKTRKSDTGGSSTKNDNEEKGRKGSRWLRSLPHVSQSQFVTTTLRNAGPGMETDFSTSTKYEETDEYPSHNLPV